MDLHWRKRLERNEVRWQAIRDTNLMDTLNDIIVMVVVAVVTNYDYNKEEEEKMI